MVSKKQTQQRLPNESLSGKKLSHRAVAPVIATLLMVAIAVVGGTIIFVFSQGFFSDAQISSTPMIELVEISGYDARDVDTLRVHDGTVMAAGTGGNMTNSGKNTDERVTVFVRNDGTQQVAISDLRLGGTVYQYNTAPTISMWNSTGSLSQGEFSLLTGSSSVLQELTAVIQPGQELTIVVDLDDNFVLGRDTQFRLTTIDGAIFVGTIIMGHTMG